MNEVATQTAALLLDSIERQGMNASALWSGLPITIDQIRAGRPGRIDWSTWVEMIQRVAGDSPVPMEELFVPGAGMRAGHPFVRIAQTVVSLRDTYAFLARWGTRRGFQIMRARFDLVDEKHARFGMTIDPFHAGSIPTLQFFVGVLRHLPALKGYPVAGVELSTLTTHSAIYTLNLPAERPLLARARRMFGAIDGVSTTLQELERQAEEIAAKNNELAAQLAVTRERDEWLQVALDAGRIGLWRWDPATRRVQISGQLADWLETNGQTDIDTFTWRRLVHPDDQPTLAKRMAEMLERREPVECDYRIIKPDGKVIWLHLNARAETDSGGAVYAYGSATDVTAEKLMETNMRAADRLIAAGTLAAGIAHEINNPLTYVLGSIELMQLRLAPYPEASAATEELMNQVLDGVERIRAVVADVRSFARQDEDAVDVVEPRRVCSAAIRIVATDVRHRATIREQHDDDTPAVRANESKLGQVLINLIVNASQAMPARPVSENVVIVRTRRSASGDAVLEVEDNGTGIAPDVLPRVFDPFFTTKPIGLGTGLGLPVCSGIVTSLGGRIEVDSELGRGTKFSVILPAASAASVAVIPPEPEPAPVPEPEPVTSAVAQVLVIDDEPMIRSVVARTLASHGYQVAEAANGREGLDRALSGDDRQVILCDLMMPDLDGAALYAQLLAVRPELAQRIVFISGGAVTERMRAFIERPDVVVLQKPFALEGLVEAIARAAGN